MLSRLADLHQHSLDEAELCRFRAVLALSDAERIGYERLEVHWRGLADAYLTAGRVSGYIEWRLRRLRGGWLH